MALKVIVDLDLCQGHSVCLGECPEVFDVIDQDPAADEEGSYFEFGRFNHTAWETGNLATTSRIDIMGINCAVSPDWAVEAAPAR